LLESFNSQIASKISEESLRKYETYEHNENLQNFTKEALRLFSASSQLFPRLALKDFKLGKYSIRKGTNLNIFFNTFHHSDEVYQNCWKFEPDRFKSISEGQKKSKPAEFMPFSLGKRNCIGRYLGELFVQSILLNFAKKFEMRALPDYEVSAVQGITYGLDSCFIRLKPRSD